MKGGSLLHKLAWLIVAIAVVLFVFAFLKTIAAPSGACSGHDCLEGDMRWALLIPASLVVFAAGFVLLNFGGRGYGRTHGPRSFDDVDSGKWEPKPADPAELSRPPTRRWTRTWRNTYLGTGLFELGLASLFAIAALTHPATGRSFIPVTVILGTLGVVLLLLGRRAAQRDRLHETGLEGRATVAGVKQTGLWMNQNPYVQLDLIVDVPGHKRYEVKHNETVPQVALGRLTNGEALPVRVDPQHPSHLVIQWERV